MNTHDEYNMGNIEKEQAERITECLDALRDMRECRDNLNYDKFITTHTKAEIDKEYTKLLKATDDFINNAKNIKEEYAKLTFFNCLSIIQ